MGVSEALNELKAKLLEHGFRAVIYDDEFLEFDGPAVTANSEAAYAYGSIEVYDDLSLGVSVAYDLVGNSTGLRYSVSDTSKLDEVVEDITTPNLN